MARKVKPSATAPAEGADDLTVLHPDRSATIAGRAVTVREYGFIEGLGLRPVAQAFLDDLHASVAGGTLPELEGILVILGHHHLAIEQLIATAADVEQDWVAHLNQDDGYHLLMLWWAANGPFFVRSVFQRIATERQLAALRDGAKSTQP